MVPVAIANLGNLEMKKVLLGTTALLGAGLVASPAFAADGIKLGVGGFFKTAYMVNFDDDSEGEPGNERNTDGVFSDAEIFFTGSTVLDNGLEVGARVELEGEDDDGVDFDNETDDGDQIDEAWIYYSGGFGEIRIGSDDDALANACADYWTEPLPDRSFQGAEAFRQTGVRAVLLVAEVP